MTTRTRAKKPTKPSTRKRPAPKTNTPAQLPTRPIQPEFMTELQTAAHYAAALAGITHTRITGWHKQDDGTARYHLDTGAGLTYNPDAEQPLTAWTPCRQNVRHPHPITTRADLLQAQINAARCTDPHGTTPVRLLADRITLANEDTQTTDVTALRAATDTPQDHPHD